MLQLGLVSADGAPVWTPIAATPKSCWASKSLGMAPDVCRDTSGNERSTTIQMIVEASQGSSNRPEGGPHHEVHSVGGEPRGGVGAKRATSNAVCPMGGPGACSSCCRPSSWRNEPRKRRGRVSAAGTWVEPGSEADERQETHPDLSVRVSRVGDPFMGRVLASNAPWFLFFRGARPPNRIPWRGALPLARFEGLLFCTSNGVLNYGSSTVEISIKIGERLAELSLADAEATRWGEGSEESPDAWGPGVGAVWSCGGIWTPGIEDIRGPDKRDQSRSTGCMEPRPSSRRSSAESAGRSEDLCHGCGR